MASDGATRIDAGRSPADGVRFPTAGATRAGAWAWILAIQFFVAQAVVQYGWSTPFSLARNFISDLGNTECAFYPRDSDSFVCSPWHPWMNASFVLLGVSICAGAWLLRDRFAAGRSRAIGVALLMIAGVGVILVGCYPENVDSRWHRAGAGMNFVCGNLAMCVLGAALARARNAGAGRGRFALAAYSIAAGALGLVATALLVSDVFLGLGVGGMERVAAYELPVWMIVFGAASLRSPRGERTPAT